MFRHDADNYGVRGIDVSHHQGLIDWAAVGRGGVDFVFMKATEGRSLRDKAFLYNWAGAEDLGIRRGAYHFFRPGVSPTEQASLFIRTVDLRPGDFPPVLDVEKAGGLSSGELVKAIRAFSERIEEHYKAKPILYTGQNFYNRHLAGQLKDHYVWMARYDRDEPFTVDGRAYQFWQYSDRGRTRGIEGRVDQNVFTGSATDWVAMAIPGATPVLPPRIKDDTAPITQNRNTASPRRQPKAPAPTRVQADPELADFESY